MGEVWVSAASWVGLYEVSSFAKIRSVSRFVPVGPNGAVV